MLASWEVAENIAACCNVVYVKESRSHRTLFLAGRLFVSTGKSLKFYIIYGEWVYRKSVVTGLWIY